MLDDLQMYLKERRVALALPAWPAASQGVILMRAPANGSSLEMDKHVSSENLLVHFYTDFLAQSHRFILMSVFFSDS